MLKLRICAECGRLLTDVTVAMRQHQTDMLLGMKLNLEGYLTEEVRERMAPEVMASFNRAQALWDSYREHLVGHGLLEPQAKTARVPARSVGD
jgi:hypothetical protein